MSPISAFLIGIFSFFNSFTSASSEPIVSDLINTPFDSVSILTESISDLMAAPTSSILPKATRIWDPASAPSRPGAAILIPEAATTFFTCLNFSSERISESGLGFKRARIFVEMGASLLPTTIVSPTFNSPSYNITSSVVPRPVSSLTSSTVPMPGPTALYLRSFSRNFCASPIKIIRRSGIPSPVFALTGMIPMFLWKSRTLSYLSELKPIS